MPILHIHSPETYFAAPLDELLPKSHTWFIEELSKLGGHLAIRQAGFSEDITPACFEGARDMAPTRYSLNVHETGERATVTLGAPPGVTMNKFSTHNHLISITADIEQLRIPEDCPAFPLTQADSIDQPPISTQVGGFLLHANLAEARSLAYELFPARHTGLDPLDPVVK